MRVEIDEIKLQGEIEALKALLTEKQQELRFAIKYAVNGKAANGVTYEAVQEAAHEAALADLEAAVEAVPKVVPKAPVRAARRRRSDVTYHRKGIGLQRDVLLCIHTGKTTAKEIASALAKKRDKVEHAVSGAISRRFIVRDENSGELGLLAKGREAVATFLAHPDRLIYTPSRSKQKG